MAKQNLNIAIFGATGHIGKNLSYYFSQDKKNNLNLFGRNKKKIQKTMKEVIPDGDYSFVKYNKFDGEKYDIILNCVGIKNPADILKKNNIIEVVEYYDNIIIDYIKKKKSTMYINFSSGAIYGRKFESPVSESSIASINVNKQNENNSYAISKLYLETKHRNLNYLNIVDLRIFSFFSRFIDLKTEFLMSQITNSLKNNTVFETDKNDIIRDYIHPQELFKIIKKCMKKEKINTVFNISSKKPISKFCLLKTLTKKYGLEYVIQKKKKISSTGLKLKYYSKSKKFLQLGVTPKYTSLETILTELKFLINSNE